MNYLLFRLIPNYINPLQLSNFLLTLGKIRIMENSNELYPLLNDEGKEQAQNLINLFERKLKESAIEIMKSITSDFYCDVLHHIESDHWQNYRNQLLNGFKNYQNKKHLTHDFDSIRRSIYKNHKEEIVKDLNQDLLLEIKDLKSQIANFRKNI